MTTPVVPIKDPDARLDYYFDWKALTNGTGESDWLAGGETITAFTVTADAGITVDDDPAPALINGATAVKVWLSGGTAGRVYAVTNHIETSAGRTDDRTLMIRVQER